MNNEEKHLIDAKLQYERERLVKDLRGFIKDVVRSTTETADILELRDEIDTHGRERMEQTVKEATRLFARLKEYEAIQTTARALCVGETEQRVCGIPGDRLETMLEGWKGTLEEFDELAEGKIVSSDEAMEGMTRFEHNMLTTLRKWMQGDKESRHVYEITSEETGRHAMEGDDARSALIAFLDTEGEDCVVEQISSDQFEVIGPEDTRLFTSVEMPRTSGSELLGEE